MFHNVHLFQGPQVSSKFTELFHRCTLAPKIASAMEALRGQGCSAFDLSHKKSPEEWNFTKIKTLIKNRRKGSRTGGSCVTPPRNNMQNIYGVAKLAHLKHWSAWIGKPKPSTT